MEADAPFLRRQTRQLAMVLAAVQAAGASHPTADDVFQRVRRVLPRVSRGTVYRNLQRLAGEGRIGVAQLGSRAARFDPTPTPHDHFLCEACGALEDLPGPMPAARARRAGHVVRAHALVLYGRCRGCGAGS
jgi:Fe2+ or Zn2+ uptake regulation protein